MTQLIDRKALTERVIPFDLQAQEQFVRVDGKIFFAGPWCEYPGAYPVMEDGTISNDREKAISPTTMVEVVAGANLEIRETSVRNVTNLCSKVIENPRELTPGGFEILPFSFFKK